MKQPQLKTCQICGKQFKKPKSVGYKLWNSRKVCSQECKGILLSQKFKVQTSSKTCVVCGKSFVRAKAVGLEKWSKQKTCSKQCGDIEATKTRIGHPYYSGRWFGHKLSSQKCLICGKTYERPKGIYGDVWKNRKTCSIRCRIEWNRQQGHGFKKGHKLNVGKKCRLGKPNKNKIVTNPKKCSICGKVFEKPYGLGLKKWNIRKSCSRRCEGISRRGKPRKNYRGKNHPNWKGGVTALRKKVQNLTEYKEWRKAVFVRDDYTCQKCGVRGGYLNADHIKSYSVIIQEHRLRTIDQAKNCQELWDVSNGRTLCLFCHRKTPTYGAKLLKKPKVTETL